MSRLLIISNRLPLNVERKDGKLQFQPSLGGLATALGAFYKSRPSLWIGWPGIEQEKLQKGEEKEIEDKLAEERCCPVFLSGKDVDDFYFGFCNQTIWPLFHYFPQFVEYDPNLWQAYQKVNEIFADAIVNVAREDDIFWVQDYHFMLLPKLIRDRLPKATIGFFLHIPFPSYEVYRLLPWSREIVEGLLGANLVGFHTHDYVWHFLNSARNLLGYSSSMGWITTTDHVSKADVFPIGIGYEYYSSIAKSPEVDAEVKKFREKLGDQKIIVSVDRLDYSKGIPNRLEAYGLFLEKHPEYREKVVFILVIGPSRIKVQRYAELKQQIEEMVGTINGKFGTIGWTPLEYLYSPIPYHALLGLYKMADVCPITPLRDGMNLVAKEYLATKIDGKGVLILSETTGAARELGDAIIINPNNIEEIAQAFADSLAMPEKEQIERNRAMQERIKLYDIGRWAGDFINKLHETEKIETGTVPEPMSDKVKSELTGQFQKAQKRLLLLDYDGTLVPFAETPEGARPDAELLKLLGELNNNARNEVVLISGRDKNTFDKWFGSLNTGMVAEHGVWMKAKGGDWGMMTGLSNDWKDEARAIMKLAVDRIEGSLIEEKDYSLAWHYRKANPRISERHIREIANDLLNLTANSNLKVLEGSKVIEVKNANLNKGLTAQQWLSRENWDFVLAIGDDVTDEDLFKALPENAWSIKVRLGVSAAKFSVDSPDEVRALLRELMVK
ncbi:MAG: bifunctional alpha,alpha-trehalose-phosphate synthase (UDP-forming)/trehalose-phosphatase [Chloroflexi bacterium]|nr:bifunctional alpha,alpha-trehalose-phosphate synthase (UDP-forming)/trehalose-phosphatase [Chloroflexota bacterium]